MSESNNLIITGHEPWIAQARLPETLEFAREETQLNVVEYSDLIRKSGLNRPIDQPDRIAAMIMNSNVMVTVRTKKDGQLVGAARSLSDFSWCCYLSDLCVDPDMQGLGIGRALVAETKRIVGPDTSLLLVSAPTAIDFYSRIGMETLSSVFVIRRDAIATPS